MTISNDTRSRIKKVGEPIALFFGRLGLTPDGLTLVGFAITAVGAVLLGLEQWVAGGLVVFVGGVFDMFDGTLARATGRVSKLGAFMDSVVRPLGRGARLRRPDRRSRPRRLAGLDLPRRRGDGFCVPRQLCPGEGRGPRLHGGHGDGGDRHHARARSG